MLKEVSHRPDRRAKLRRFLTHHICHPEVPPTVLSRGGPRPPRRFLLEAIAG